MFGAHFEGVVAPAASEAGDFADRAIALLREAIESGDAEADKLLAESVFDPIRHRDGFRLLTSIVPRKIGRSLDGDPAVR